MVRSTYNMAGLAIVTFVVLAIFGTANAAHKVIPPLFREQPNERLVEAPRADDDVDFRLPNNTVPVHYDIELSTNVHTGDRAFTGKVTIEIKVDEDTRSIVLHARQLRNFKATARKANDANVHEITVNSADTEREFVSFTPQNTNLNFLRGETWLLTIDYEGTLRQDNGGFYISTYTDENNRIHYLATTQFESTDARHGFPCFDEPSKRATFTITINHDRDYTAISNMPVDTAKSTPGKTVFEKTVNMPTYLIAFIISDFKSTGGELNSLPQRIFSRTGTEHDQEWALVSGMLLVERLAEYYNVKFALPKLDQVAVPDFAAGAMENWGLVTYREEYLLYNKEKSTVNTQTNIANIIAHEYTHQWFGNYVAIKWWTYLWLKEGFATLFSYQATDDAYPEWGVYQQFHTDDYQRALTSDAGQNPRPMTHYVQKPREISSLYDSISYSKAGSVLSMWQHALTNKVFRQGLHNYLDHNQFTAAEENDLFEAIQLAAKEENHEVRAPVADMMSSWTRQGGYPILTVERNYDDGSFTVKQQAFYNDENFHTDKTWYIPFNWAVQSNPDFRDTEATHYMLKVAEMKVSDAKLNKDDWFILNKQSTGYYRINYDDNNWQLIIDGLLEQPHKIHPRNRAQLMHDAYRFSASNRLKHETLMKLLTYLHKEDQYAPWSTANGILTTFNRYLSGDAEYPNFKAYVIDLVGDIYDKLGVNDVPGEQHYAKYTRSIAINLACMAGVESCLKETNDKLKGLIENGIEIEPNLQSQTYCNGLKQSSDREFDYVFNKLLTSEDQAQRRIMISSLGCAQQRNQLDKFVASSIDMSVGLRTQERTTILNPVYSRGEVGLYACIDFLKTNYEAYDNLTVGTFGGAKPLEDDIRGMSSYVVNPAQEKELLELVDIVIAANKAPNTLKQQVQNNINSNYDWLKENRDPLMSWLTDYHKSGDGGSGTMSTSLVALIVALAVSLSRLF